MPLHVRTAGRAQQRNRTNQRRRAAAAVAAAVATREHTTNTPRSAEVSNAKKRICASIAVGQAAGRMRAR